MNFILYQTDESRYKVREGDAMAKNKSTKAIGYIRVSTQGQVIDGESLERQEEKIRAYAQYKGISELEIIADRGISGSKTNRAGFQAVIDACNRKHVGTVIVYDLSRLARSLKDTMIFIEDTIQKNGIEFVSLSNDIDTSSPMGKAFLQMNALFNELYRNEVSQKLKKAWAFKREKKEKTGGTIPFGYQIVDGKRLTPHQGEQAIIAEMHMMRKQGHSLRAIVASLLERGIPTKTGNMKWDHNVVAKILDRAISEVASDPAIPNHVQARAIEELVRAKYQEPVQATRVAQG